MKQVRKGTGEGVGRALYLGTVEIAGNRGHTYPAWVVWCTVLPQMGLETQRTLRCL